jgi:hypothetical protein
MADPSTQMPSYPEGASVAFQVQGVGSGLLLSRTGDEFVAVLLKAPWWDWLTGGKMPSSVKAWLTWLTGGKMPSPPGGSTMEVSFKVDRSFAAGYLILTWADTVTYFATRVATLDQVS